MKRRRLAFSATTLALLVVGGCFGERRVSDKNIKAIELDRLVALHERQEAEPSSRRLLVLDSRPASQFATGHIPGAEHALLPDFDASLGRDPRIESFDTIVVYAEDPGSASSKALVKRLLRMRYDDVYLFSGGLKAWTGAGLPVEPAE